MPRLRNRAVNELREIATRTLRTPQNSLPPDTHIRSSPLPTYVALCAEQIAGRTDKVGNLNNTGVLTTAPISTVSSGAVDIYSIASDGKLQDAGFRLTAWNLTDGTYEIDDWVLITQEVVSGKFVITDVIETGRTRVIIDDKLQYPAFQSNKTVATETTPELPLYIDADTIDVSLDGDDFKLRPFVKGEDIAGYDGDKRQVLTHTASKVYEWVDVEEC